MPRELNPAVNTAAREDHLAQALRYNAAAAGESHQKMRQMAQSLGNLFGDAVYLVLERRLENLTENMGEAFYHYERAINERQNEVDALKRQASQARDALIHCAERLLAKYAKARKPLPEDLLQVVVIAACATGWDYLFPPTDERHRHDADSGGACRNPMCKYNSDNEPF